MAQLGLRKWGSQLTTIEREKQRREQVRKDKLIALLNQKMHRAFGLTSSHSVIEEEIESFVLNNKGDFSDLKLRQLKAQIAERLAPEGIAPKAAKTKRLGSTAAKAAGLGIMGIAEHKPAPGLNHDRTHERKQLSRGSAHSMSMKSLALSQRKPPSIGGTQMSVRSSSHRSLAESDEWREIQNFNTLLHLEQQNQEVLASKDQQKLMKQELDKQISEKKERERQERQTERDYEEMQKKLLREAERKEKLRIEQVRQRIARDKESRDRQMIMDSTIRQSEIDREKTQEALMIAKLKKELELEKMASLEQKNQRRRQMQDMRSENENAQFLARVAAQKEREEEVKIQQETMRKLDIQQNKEANTSKKLKEKAEKFVDKMASEVYTKLEQKAKREEEQIQRYTEERSMREKLEEERRLK